MECQDFKQGCCGCCVNMRWRTDRIVAVIDANTRAAEAVLRPGVRPRLRDLVRLHAARGGWRDHLLMTLLAPLTLGVAAWIWKRYLGSCCFAGFIDRETNRVGCLIHPERVGLPDLRRHAFPLIPTLGCNRTLRCPMLDRDHRLSTADDWFNVSRAGAKSLKIFIFCLFGWHYTHMIMTNMTRVL